MCNEDGFGSRTNVGADQELLAMVAFHTANGVFHYHSKRRDESVGSFVPSFPISAVLLKCHRERVK